MSVNDWREAVDGWAQPEHSRQIGTIWQVASLHASMVQVAPAAQLIVQFPPSQFDIVHVACSPPQIIEQPPPSQFEIVQLDVESQLNGQPPPVQ